MSGRERLILIFMILLRTAIGWHFLFEAYEKFHSVYVVGATETNRPWTSEPYFREGTGPLASVVRSQIGDTADAALARLTVRDTPLGEKQDAFPLHKRMPEALHQEWSV